MLQALSGTIQDLRLSDGCELPMCVKIRVFNISCLLLSLLPVLRIFLLINSTCSNVVCVDFLHATTFLNRALSGECDLQLLLRDSAMQGHPQLLPLTFHLGCAKFFALNVFTESYICMFLLCLATLLSFEALAEDKGKYRFALLPILSAIQFSFCLSSEFFYCYSLVTDSLSRVFICLGIWAIAKVRNSKAAAALVFLSGLLCATCCASYSVSVWAILGLLLFFLKRISKAFVLCFAVGFPISILPIVSLSLGGGSRVDPGSVGFEGVSRFFASAGMSLLNNTASQVDISLATVALGAILILFLAALGAYIAICRNVPNCVFCASSMAIFGILNLLCTSFARNNISPWYCTFSVFILTGICSLAFFVLTTESVKFRKVPARVGACGVLLFWFVFYLLTNRSYSDKDWFRAFHSPAAESSLRNYLWAPTYAHYQLFGSKLGNIERYWRYGKDLSLNRLSCFSSKQTWSMQGDFILPVVQFVNQNGADSIRWILDKKLHSRPSFSDPEHLSLSLPSGSSVVWYLSLPTNTKSAELVFDYAFSDVRPNSALTVRVMDAQAVERGPLALLKSKVDWHSFACPLQSMAGRRFKLIFENTGNGSGSVILRYPRILTEFQFENRAASTNVEPAPCNVDATLDYFGAVQKNMSLDGDFQNTWSPTGLRALGKSAAGLWIASDAQSCFTYRKLLNVNVNEWNEFYFDFAESKCSRPRFVLCQFILNTGKLKTGIVTLMADGNAHRYSYELKLLQLEPNERISFVQILPEWESSVPTAPFRIGRIGFARREFRLPPP